MSWELEKFSQTPVGERRFLHTRLVLLLNPTCHRVIVFCTTMADDARAPVYLPTYKLGDEGQPNHLNASISREAAAIEAKALIVGDAAFIKRSDLKWTYAILTERIEGEPVVLRFEVDKERNRKSFPEAQWGKYVRVLEDYHLKDTKH